MDIDNELQCPLCHDVYYKPTVLPCGHVYCNPCLESIGEHTDSQVSCKCPFCRRMIPGRGKGLPVCLLLEKMVEAAKPERYAERKEEEEAAMREVNERDVIPVFVLDSILPKQFVMLNVYEPRYKVMIENCLNSGKKACFGMVGIGPDGDPCKVGSEIEITECKTQRNGRYLVEGVGTRVFSVVDSWTTHGYMTAKVSWLGIGEGDETCNVAEVSKKIEDWEELVKTGGWEITPSHLAVVRSQLGPLPGTKTQLALWIAAYINPQPPLGVAEEIRSAVLLSPTHSSRLTLATEALNRSSTQLRSMSTTVTGKIRRFLYQYSILHYFPILVTVMLIHYFVHKSEE
eukprot:TRINITY_DN5805_c0_g1_i1.p1 TRINITY_DN5805_c0_g1~~TRINITY_DN5805_c0_g1_i1.p1  ORF type:complete len:344 (+),score=48.78 TRINITY_DN5805_c0_g1_i1:87-1118(+)